MILCHSIVIEISSRYKMMDYSIIVLWVSPNFDIEVFIFSFVLFVMCTFFQAEHTQIRRLVQESSGGGSELFNFFLFKMGSQKPAVNLKGLKTDFLRSFVLILTNASGT